MGRHLAAPQLPELLGHKALTAATSTALGNRRSERIFAGTPAFPTHTEPGVVPVRLALALVTVASRRLAGGISQRYGRTACSTGRTARATASTAASSPCRSMGRSRSLAHGRARHPTPAASIAGREEPEPTRTPSWASRTLLARSRGGTSGRGAVDDRPLAGTRHLAELALQARECCGDRSRLRNRMSTYRAIGFGGWMTPVFVAGVIDRTAAPAPRETGPGPGLAQLGRDSTRGVEVVPRTTSRVNFSRCSVSTGSFRISRTSRSTAIAPVSASG
jgi:hypothetical protein